MLNWIQQANYRHRNPAEYFLILSLLSYLGLEACSSYKPMPLEIESPTHMEIHLETYKEWLAGASENRESTESVIGPFLQEKLYSDFQFYEKAYPSYETILNAFDTVKTYGTKQYRLVRSLKKRKNPDVQAPISRNSTTTFDELFKENDLKIQQYQYLYDYHREQLKEAFKKKNHRCVYIDDQFLDYAPRILSLQHRYSLVGEREDAMLKDFSISISENGDYSGFLMEKIKRVQAVKQSLDDVNQYFIDARSMAKMELGASVFIAPVGEPPKPYENVLEKSIVRFEEQLDLLESILSN